jgi:hypothetical protein
MIGFPPAPESCEPPVAVEPAVLGGFDGVAEPPPPHEKAIRAEHANARGAKADFMKWSAPAPL